MPKDVEVEKTKPEVCQISSIVNSLFLSSPYEGKNWEDVRKDLITMLKVYTRNSPEPVVGPNNCPTCGTPCKVVGDTTMHYEPVEVGEDKIEDEIQLRYFKLMHPDISESDAEIVAGVLARALKSKFTILEKN